MEFSLKNVVVMAVGILLVGLLFPLGIAAIETYTPTDATTAVVWPLISVFACLAVAIGYIKSATD